MIRHLIRNTISGAASTTLVQTSAPQRGGHV